MTASTTVRTLQNYVGGAWTPASAGAETLDVVNPATGAPLAHVPLSTAADVDAAVQAARAALPAWRDVSVIRRASRLFALREALVARREALARTVTTEMGKTLEHLHNLGKNMTPKRVFLAPQTLYLLGGGATLGGIDRLLTQRLRRQVRTWTLNDESGAVAAARGVPLCLLGQAIALSALRWEPTP